MASTFSQQLRYLKRHEPSLYESISKAYRKCLMESNLGPEVTQTDAEAASTPVEEKEIKQSGTKGVDDLMSKVHAMVGVNENKKEGEEIFDTKDDDVETVQPDPQQQADLFGMDSNPEPAPVEQPAEQPAAGVGDIDFNNFFTDDGQGNASTEEPADETGELDVSELFPDDGTSDTGSEQPAEDQTQETDTTEPVV
jgi:hypothetical protein